MAEYIERTEELMLAMNDGARAIENTRLYHGAIYTKNVFSKSPQKIPYLQAAKVLREVSDATAADVATVVHGRWVGWGKSGTPTYENYGTCSVCGEDAEIYTEHRNYCHNCGADMRGINDE